MNGWNHTSSRLACKGYYKTYNTMGEQADATLEYDWWGMDDGPEEPTPCKYCGRWAFHWEIDDNGKYFLATETGKLHKCKAYENQRPKRYPSTHG